MSAPFTPEATVEATPAGGWQTPSDRMGGGIGLGSGYLESIESQGQGLAPFLAA
jgi:hypothetical protein